MSQPTPEFQTIVPLLILVNEQQEEITHLSQKFAKLEAEHNELADRLKNNSRNSNKPPPTEQAIADALKDAPVAGADETGMRVAGSPWWMHVLRTDKWTLYHLAPSKGHTAIESMGILLVFAGILVHDHYKVYFRYATLHELYNAHHLSELQGVVDRNCNHLAGRLQKLLRLACHLSNGLKKIGMKAMPERSSARGLLHCSSGWLS